MNSLDNLFARLEMAHARHAQEQKEGAIDALAAVIEYLREMGASPAQTLPLNWLGHQVTTKEPRNVKPLFLAGREGILVAAIEALMATGLKEKDASDAVSKAIGCVKTGKQLCDWRGNVREGKARDEAKTQYHAALSRIKAIRREQFADLQDGDWRKALLAMVADSYDLKKA